MKSVYLPREDSELIQKAVKKYAKGKVLDMGTGSGVLAVAAAKKDAVEHVLAADINIEAVEYAKKENFHHKVDYSFSDLFLNIKGKFDTIIFNPPYLPDDPEVNDVALDGGKRGYEVTVNFLEKAKKFLKTKGEILLLFSSLTNKGVIDKTLEDQAYIYEEIDNQKLEFETLYVYKIRKLESMVKGIKFPKFYARGKRGIIYKAIYRTRIVGIKIQNQKSEAHNRILIEGMNLLEANKIKIGPKLVEYTDNYVMYNFVNGTLLPEFMQLKPKNEIQTVLKKVFRQMRKLDEENINKEEMTNPYKHIVVTIFRKPVLLDFERANKTLKPKNVTQFCQYVTSKNVTHILKGKGFKIPEKKIFKQAAKYKEKYSKQEFDKLLEMIK